MWARSKALPRCLVFGSKTAIRRASLKVGEPTTLRIRLGALRGKTLCTESGKFHRSFLGIPYAKPPVGNLRFQPPQPADSWNGERDATKHGEIAPQKNLFTGSCRGNDDCLYLNVFTPSVEEKNNDLKPVMVWLHGGGFIMGSGNTDFFGPDYLMEHDVVLVTLNYRLGVLGFLSTGDSVVPGNMGLKDQVEALLWIKNNIADFGGDPNNVTVFGGSAGGMSVEFLMLSTKGKGLFHHAISQSGVAIAESICCREVPERTFRLAKALGHSPSNSVELLEFMRKIPAETLIENQHKGLSEKDKARLLYFPFLPTFEESGSDSFIYEHPLETLKNSSYSSVPYLLGANEFEGMVYFPEITGKKEVLAFLDKNFENLIPFDIAEKLSNKTPTADKIRKFYFKNERLTESSLDILLNVLGDKMFLYPTVRAAKLHSVQKSTPVFLYHFTVDTGLNYAKRLFGCPDKPGACHSDETGYLFKNNLMPVKINPKSVEHKTVQRITKLWTNFAKKGNPTPEDDPLLNIQWPSLNTNNAAYVNIGNEGLEVRSNLEPERISFWNGLYNKLNV